MTLDLEHPHHAKQHARITDSLRWVTAGTLPMNRRAHAARQLAWAISDHLRCCHQVRRNGQRRTPSISRLAAIHAALHGTAS